VFSEQLRIDFTTEADSRFCARINARKRKGKMGSWWQDFLDWITKYKDALSVLLGSGVLAGIGTGIYKLIAWLAKASRARKTRTDTSPFKIIPPNSNVAKEILGGADDDPLADRNIPYQQRVEGRNTRREIEDLLELRRWVLITGRTGLGKTREAVHVAESLNEEGWTVLFLTREQWLDTPARLPAGIPDRKLLFLLDDLNRKCYAGRVEQSPKAGELLQPLTESLQKRLQRVLEAYETLCGKGEISVIATARDEKEREFPDEPSEWEKLEFNKYQDIWQQFERYELPQPENLAAENLLAETVPQTKVKANPQDFASFARSNDGTFANLVENLRTACNGGQPLNRETFRDTLKGTWEKRYRLAIAKNHHAKYIYDAVDLARSVGLNLSFETLWSLANIVAGKGFHIVKNWKALREIVKIENIIEPRDGQIEAKGYRLDRKKYLPYLYKQIWRQWALSESPHRFWYSVFMLPFFLFRAFFCKPSTLSKIFNGEKLSTREKILIVYLSSDITLIELAWAYGDLGYTQEAIYLLNESLTLNRISPFRFLVDQRTSKGAYLWNQLGDYLRDAGDLNKAVNAFQTAIDLSPKFATPWTNLGGIYHTLGRTDDAIASCKKAIELDPKVSISWNNLGYIYLCLGRADEAIAAYQKAIELDPKSTHPWIGLGIVSHRLGFTDEAIAAYQMATKLDAKSAAPWAELGNLYLFLNRTDEAIAAYQKAITLDSKDATLWNNLGGILLGQNNDEAITVLQKAIELDPKAATSWQNLGSIYQGLDRTDEAIESFKKAIELDPKLAISWFSLGSIYQGLERTDEAIASYKKAIELDPKFAYFWDALGGVYRTLARTDEAITAYQKAIELDPKFVVAYSSLAACYRELGYDAESAKQIEITRPLMEKESEYTRACFESICGNSKEALRLLKIALEKKHVLLARARRDPNFNFIRDDPRFKELVGEK
jgi:tetratricopeptide (TPR) repeat protein